MTTRILGGDVREMLATLPAESVHCVVTSPPYYGLRDYGADGQIGMEPTLAEYLDTMVEVMRAVRRVMRKDATCWLNIGDSYAGSCGAQGWRVTESDEPSWHSSQIKNHPKQASNIGSIRDAGLKPKDLMLVPHRLAIALQADGWWVRAEIVWSKLNPMPESVTDRCTRAHEFVFMLTRSAKYFFDAEAIKEASLGGSHDRGSKRSPPIEQAGIGHKGWVASMTRDAELTHRNKRSVWTLASEPFPEAHFATFPTRLAEPCILAGTSAAGVCPSCGAPWVRIIESQSRRNASSCAGKYDGIGKHRTVSGGVAQDYREKRDLGWRGSCSCAAAEPIPAIVLDPFLGSGTTALVADRLGRDCIGIEINPGYAEMARERIAADAGMFAEVAAE